jgi:hypothetical protein
VAGIFPLCLVFEFEFDRNPDKRDEEGKKNETGSRRQ